MARKWENIICYEDRGLHIFTSRWLLSGIKTKESAENTDSGVLWLKTVRVGNTVTAELYKDDGLGISDKVASGTANVADCDGTGANAVECALSQANTSGLSGSFWIHDYYGDGTCPLQIALCSDEDLDSLCDAIEALPGYDSTYGCAEFIRVAGDDLIGRVTAMYQEHIGGHGAPEAWFITDASRSYPDLRMIANPGQLRLACAHRAIAISVGRSHQMAQDTMYSSLRDYHNAEYEKALASLALALKPGNGANAEESQTGNTIRMARA